MGTTEEVDVDDGVTLHLRRWPGNRPPSFLLLHGLASNARLWDGVAAELAARGHAVVAPDLRGHGRSSKPAGGYDVATVAADLLHVLGVLDAGGFGRPVVAGQSWGGNVALELAAQRSARLAGLVCVDGGAIELHRRFPDWDACVAVLRPPPLAGSPIQGIEAMLRRAHPDWPDSGIEATLACFAVDADGTARPHLDLDRHLRVLRGLWDHRPVERARAVEVPVLFLNAGVGPNADPDERRRQQDRAESTERVAGALPGPVEVEWIVGDHDLHAQFPVRVAARLRRFAEDVADPTR